MGEYDSELQTPSPHEVPLDPERIDTAGVVFPDDVEPDPPVLEPGNWRTDWANSPEAEETRAAAEAYQAEQLGGGAAATSASGAYDPGEYAVADVVTYVEEHPDQLDAVYAAEEGGKARTTLLTQLDGMRG